MKTYKETKKAVKELIILKGLNNLFNYDLVNLYNEGHNVTNVQNAIDYFRYSPQAEKFRTQMAEA